LVKGEDGTAAGNVNDTIGNGRRLCQRAKIGRGECPAADTGGLIDSDCITTVSNINRVIHDRGRRGYGAGLVVAPNLSAVRGIIDQLVATAVADEEQVIAECRLDGSFA